MMKGRKGLVVSASQPMSMKPQPPMGVIISSEAALFFSAALSPLTASEKMVGNMMASNR